MNNLYDYYKEFQLPLIYLIADMEDRGVKVDLDYANEMHIKYTNLLNKSTLKIYDLVGEKFKVDSSAELSKMLFNKLNFEPTMFTPKTGRPSTDKKHLEILSEKYKHPVLKELIERSTINKILTTYILTLTNKSIDGIIHCTVNQTGTNLSRLSYKDPNLQQIPVRSKYAKDIQDIFIARDGYKFLDVDLAGIEMRIFAFLANEKNLLDIIYTGIKGDIHGANACLLLGISEEEMKADKKKNDKTSMRDAIKHAGFSMLYGAHKQKVQDTIRDICGMLVPLTDQEAKAKNWKYSIESIFRGFNKRATNAVAWKRKVLKELYDTGEVITLFGRRRRLPNIYSNEIILRMEAERKGINAMIQTPAGDVCEHAGVRMHKKLQVIDAHPLINVHDSFLIEAPEDRIEDAYEIIKESFLTPMDRLDVPLGISVSIGDKWGSMEFYNETSSIEEGYFQKAA